MCDRYASEQHGQLCKAVRNGENIDASDNISKFIVDDDMIQMVTKSFEHDNEG